MNSPKTQIRSNKKRQEKQPKIKGKEKKENLHSAQPVRRAWPCKPESLFPSRSTLLQERETNPQHQRLFWRDGGKNEEK